jgi:hypothetical protein
VSKIDLPKKVKMPYPLNRITYGLNTNEDDHCSEDLEACHEYFMNKNYVGK